MLTHDVESAAGLDRVRQLAEMEMELGFRSSFNFVPEGDYRVPKELRDWLTDNGFEVGVHDLHHDGQLFSSRESFLRKAQRINIYLGNGTQSDFARASCFATSIGCTSLNIAYDMSTFDTDPFEPQPDGVNTIFPILGPERIRGRRSEVRRSDTVLKRQRNLILSTINTQLSTSHEVATWSFPIPFPRTLLCFSCCGKTPMTSGSKNSIGSLSTGVWSC